MSLTIKTYKVDGYDNEIDKELTTPISTLTGNFRDDFNILTPAFIIDDSASILYNLSFNYIKVETMNRYYFVTDWTRTVTGLIALSLQEDVLKTFETALSNTLVIMSRCTNLYNNAIDDPLAIRTLGKTWDYIPPLASPTFKALRQTYIDFGDGILDDAAIQNLPDTTADLRVVVKVTSKNYLNGGVKANPKTTSNVLVMTPRALAIVLKEIWEATFTNPEKAICDITVMPFALPSIDNTYINNNRIASMDMTVWSTNTVKFYENSQWLALCVRANMNKLRGENAWHYNISTLDTSVKYSNSGKYRQWYWDCQPFGMQNINPDDLLGYTYLKIAVEYDFEGNCGELYYQGYNDIDDDTTYTPKVYLQPVQLGRETQVLAQGQFNKQALSAIGSIAGVAASVVSLGASAAATIPATKAANASNYLAKEAEKDAFKKLENQLDPSGNIPANISNKKLDKLNSSILDAGQSIADYNKTVSSSINSVAAMSTLGAHNLGNIANGVNSVFANMQPSIRCIGQSPNASWVTSTSPRLYEIRQTIITYDANEIGKPSTTQGYIRTVEGYVQAPYIYWETFQPTIPITSSEKEIIQNMLATGVFYNRPHSG